MDSRTLLIFDLDDARFGLDATAVLESVRLPELTPIEEAPPWIVGIFSLRGRIVAVTDLHLYFGHPARHYSLGNQVVILKTDRLPIGLIVSEVLEVIELLPDAIQPSPDFETPAHHGLARLAAGAAWVGDGLVTLLDVSQLAKPPEAPPQGELPERATPDGYFCPEASPETRAQFHARAVALREAAIEEEASRLGLAVVELGGEYFGIALASVQEFCRIAHVSPIPCCPPHILGAMSLRGNLLTLIDPRSALNLPLAARGGKAVIARISAGLGAGPGEQSMGIAVEEVHGVVYLRNEDLLAPSPALRERCGPEIAGTALYEGRTIAVLDLPALLAREEWIVNENV